ncbi:hypothetical protein FACS189490_13220 [Clostridia bacterium]|nr:hypothetical protein FACS189490_13220 [Clostridia bacterium]
MLLELVLKPLFLLLGFILDLIPALSFGIDFNIASLVDFLAFGFWAFPFNLFIIIIGNVLFWLNRKSNNVFARIYDKTKEVIQMGYKGFFFKVWHDNGLINFYDKYCLEYALTYKNYDYIHKGRLMFYIEYGADERVKKEFELSLKDENMTLAQYKALADAYVPQVTTIVNIEYETKRKFYYYSDNFIEAFKMSPRENVPKPFERLFKILDNRAVFLDYLTSKSLCFFKRPKSNADFADEDDTDTDNEREYLSWWKRLRNTKQPGFDADTKLLRDYSHKMDTHIIKAKAINAIASSAVYADNLDTDFTEDLSDFLADLNDNSKEKAELLQFYAFRKSAKNKTMNAKASSINPR